MGKPDIASSYVKTSGARSGTGGLFVTGLMFIRAGAHVCSVYSNIRVFPLRVSSVRASYRERYLLILTLLAALHSDQYFALPTVL